MTAITWLPATDLGDQRGTCGEGTLLLRRIDDGPAVKVAFHPNLLDGETVYSLNDAIEAHTAWSPEVNRLTARHPYLPGSSLGWFPDAASAREQITRVLGEPEPSESVEAQLAAAGFTADRDGAPTFIRYAGPLTLEIGVSDEGVGLRAFEGLTQRRDLLRLLRPFPQHSPLQSVGVWPQGCDDPRRLVAAAIRMAERAIGP